MYLLAADARISSTPNRGRDFFREHSQNRASMHTNDCHGYSFEGGERARHVRATRYDDTNSARLGSRTVFRVKDFASFHSTDCFTYISIRSTNFPSPRGWFNLLVPDATVFRSITFTDATIVPRPIEADVVLKRTSTVFNFCEQRQRTSPSTQERDNTNAFSLPSVILLPLSRQP